MKIEEKVSLAPYTTFGIGGLSRYFIAVATEQELGIALESAQKKNLRIFILGGGSNVLVSDEGFDGLVIKNEIKGFEINKEGREVFLTYKSGEAWDSLVGHASAEGLSGIELLSGIPGTVGAAPVQNIGAYGTSIDRVLRSVRAYDRKTKEFVDLSRDSCRFSYRSSIFKEEGKDRYVITSATLRLSKETPSIPSYPDLAAYFREGSTVTTQEIREAVIQVRAQKGMVIKNGYESYKSAGSFFQNPVISKHDFSRLGVLTCRSPWHWELPDGRVKVAAACLIGQAGFAKGYREGNVGISPRHTLAIINYGNASAKEIKDFADNINNRVQEKFSILLEPEVQYIGF